MGERIWNYSYFSQYPIGCPQSGRVTLNYKLTLKTIKIGEYVTLSVKKGSINKYLFLRRSEDNRGVGQLKVTFILSVFTSGIERFVNKLKENSFSVFI